MCAQTAFQKYQQTSRQFLKINYIYFTGLNYGKISYLWNKLSWLHLGNKYLEGLFQLERLKMTSINILLSTFTWKRIYGNIILNTDSEYVPFILYMSCIVLLSETDHNNLPTALFTFRPVSALVRRKIVSSAPRLQRWFSLRPSMYNPKCAYSSELSYSWQSVK